MTLKTPTREGAMKSQNLIHQIGDLVINAIKIPFSRFTLLNEDRILDLLEDLETSLPEELKKAEEVLVDRDKLLAEARHQAEEILTQARQQALVLISEHEITRSAQSEVERLRGEIELESAKNLSGADRYADEVLADLEAKIARALATIQNGRQALGTH